MKGNKNSKGKENRKDRCRKNRKKINKKAIGMIITKKEIRLTNRNRTLRHFRIPHLMIWIKNLQKKLKGKIMEKANRSRWMNKTVRITTAKTK